MAPPVAVWSAAVLASIVALSPSRGRAAPEGAPGAVPGSHVHIEVRGRATVGLHRTEAATDVSAEPRRVKICDAPCDQHVEALEGARFVLDGPRMTPSLSFSLADKPARFDVVVRPGFRALSVVGWVSVAVGAAAVLAGGVTLTLADDDRRLRRAGGFTMLAGLPLLAGGGIVAAFGRTRFRFVGAGEGRGRRRSSRARAATAATTR